MPERRARDPSRDRRRSQCPRSSHGARRYEQPTQIVWMPCRFGGARPYFVCPGIVNGIACGRRVAKRSGEMEIDWSCRIGPSCPAKNGGRSNSQPRLSGCRADLAARGPISFVRALSTGLLAAGGWPSSTEPGHTSSAAIVIGSPMRRSAKIATIGHCGGPIIFACGLAASRELRGSFLHGLKACTARLTSGFNPRR